MYVFKFERVNFHIINLYHFIHKMFVNVIEYYLLYF